MALTSEYIQQQMATDLEWMTRHAATQRDRLVLLLLRETGARLSEVLGMTAGGYRKATDPYQVYVTNKGSNGREEKPVKLSSAAEAALMRYVRTERARYDRHGRKRLADLDDADPLFLTRRGTPYTRDAFYHHWRQLFAHRPKQHVGGKALPPLEFTAHDMRHLRVTEWLTQIAKRCAGDQQQERRLRSAVQRRMGWRSPLTIHCYDHSSTEREEEDAFAEFQRGIEQGTSALAPVTKSATSPCAPERRVSFFSPATVQQMHTDLAFWEDEV